MGIKGESMEQARKRQVNLIAKLLRQLEEEDIQQIQVELCLLLQS